MELPTHRSWRHKESYGWRAESSAVHHKWSGGPRRRYHLCKWAHTQTKHCQRHSPPERVECFCQRNCLTKQCQSFAKILTMLFSSCRKVVSFHKNFAKSFPLSHFQQLQPESHRSGLQNVSEGRVGLPKRMSFRKTSEGGGVNFQSKNLHCRFWTII